MNLIESIILEFGPCSTTEILDYLRSDLVFQKGHYSKKEWTRSKIRYQLNKILKNNPKIFKFSCNSGYSVRYGLTKFEYYLLEEPRYLKPEGYLKRCMYCGMPIYINGAKVFHFRYNCKQYHPQNYFTLLTVKDFWAILSRDFIYGILENLQSCEIRLPANNQTDSDDDIISELWLINKKAHEKGIIEFDRFMSLKAEEFIT